MSNTIWQPQAGPQTALVSCNIFEVFYGGARGGGKTDGMIGKNAIKAAKCGRHQKGMFMRKDMPQLDMAIERCKQIYFPLGWKWGEQKKTFTAPNSATLKFRMLDNEDDAEKYQGHDYTDLYMEELTNWKSPGPVNKMRGTLRSAHDIPVQFHGTGNPGGKGHHWVKARYIDPAPGGYEILEEEFTNPFTGKNEVEQRIFIPSKLIDNQKLMQADPKYVLRLQQSGSEALVRAWLLGDWNIIDGAFFDCWSPRMVHRPFLVPPHWKRIVSFDWGSAKPFSCGWWAIVEDDYTTPEGVLLPRGYALRYREWYGVKRERDGTVIPDVGLKMTAEAVGAGIRKRSTEKIADWVADPSIFKEDGGPSHFERMGLPFRKADNTRIARQGYMGGWDQLRSRMIGTRTYDDNMVLQDDGWPMIGCFNTCPDFIRTMPALQHDPNNIEDLDTNSEDHIADDSRYFAMSRPWRARVPTRENVIHTDAWGRPRRAVGGWKTA
ncbi:MAG: terminase [Xanthomonadales bacterium]|nr:terminase [Xanthomonadales bacterium]